MEEMGIMNCGICQTCNIMQENVQIDVSKVSGKNMILKTTYIITNAIFSDNFIN